MKMLDCLSSLLVFLGFAKRPIELQDLYEIIGNAGPESYHNLPEYDKQRIHPRYRNREDYLASVEKAIKKEKLEKHVKIIKIEDRFAMKKQIKQKDRLYAPSYEIVIKNLKINTNNTRSVANTDIQPEKFIFGASKNQRDLHVALTGVNIIFEKNHFVSSRKDVVQFTFNIEGGAHLIFKKNKFISSFLHPLAFFIQIETAHKLSIVTLTGNALKIATLAISRSEKNKGFVLLEDNIFSTLMMSGVDYSLKGRNYIDNLNLMDNIKPTYWGPYQQLGFTYESIASNQDMLKDLIEHAASEKNRAQEAIFRRELLKCEAALIHAEKITHAFQDKLILGWSAIVSNYGISWIRPLLLLIGINASFAFLVMCLLFQGVTWATSTTWLLLFAEFFNPLSSLTEIVEKIDGSLISPSILSEQPNGDASKTVSRGLLSSINVVQKIFLGIFYYEIIKIFRRFSK